MFYSPKIYNNVDNCPIGVFNKVLESSDYSLLCYKGKAKEKGLFESWKLIYDGYVKLFGVPESFQKYAKGMARAGRLFLDSMEEGQIWKRALYEAEKAKAEYELTRGQSQEFSKILALVSKEMGYRVDPSKVTIKEFHGYLKLLENG